MISANFFKKKIMIPQSGIDVIKLYLSPIFFNVAFFKTNPFVDPYKRLTIHRRGMFYTLEIHIEYMNLNEDFHITFARAIYDLIFSGFILFPKLDGLVNFIYNNLNWFVLGVNASEFYFNLLPDKVSVNEESVANYNLIQYRINGEGTYSYYSNDYKVKKKTNNIKDKVNRKIVRHSRVHLYDKYEKNLQDNRISHAILNEDPYHIRLEFKLLNDNCSYLSLDNFKGNYSEVLNRFSSYLAVIYNNYILGNIMIIGKNNKQMVKVMRKSKSAGTRYTGKELLPSQKIPEWVRSGKGDYRNQMKKMILEQKSQNDEMPETVKEHIENIINLHN